MVLDEGLRYLCEVVELLVICEVFHVVFVVITLEVRVQLHRYRCCWVIGTIDILIQCLAITRLVALHVGC